MRWTRVLIWTLCGRSRAGVAADAPTALQAAPEFCARSGCESTLGQANRRRRRQRSGYEGGRCTSTARIWLVGHVARCVNVLVVREEVLDEVCGHVLVAGHEVPVDVERG